MKLAILDDDTVVPYDHLLLCTGNQFPIIAPFQETVINPLNRKPVAAKPDRMLLSKIRRKNLYRHLSLDLEQDPHHPMYWLSTMNMMRPWPWNGCVCIIMLNVRDSHRFEMKIKMNCSFHRLIDSILIYGSTLEAYCCVNALLTNGIPAKSIKLIHPPNQNHVSSKRVYFSQCSQKRLLSSKINRMVCSMIPLFREKSRHN